MQSGNWQMNSEIRDVFCLETPSLQATELTSRLRASFIDRDKFG